MKLAENSRDKLSGILLYTQKPFVTPVLWFCMLFPIKQSLEAKSSTFMNFSEKSNEKTQILMGIGLSALIYKVFSVVKK